MTVSLGMPPLPPPVIAPRRVSRKIKVGKIGLTYEGVVTKLKKGLGSKDPEQLQPHVRVEYEKIFTRKLCPACKGARLNQAALGSKLGKKNIAELSAMQVSDLAPFVRAVKAKSCPRNQRE